MPNLRHWISLCETVYQDWHEAYVNNQPVVRVEDDGVMVAPDFLFRVMSLEEYETAKKTGFFSPKVGQRIHAANRPIETYGSGGDTVTVRFDYRDEDGWKAKWGDELYATTNARIPFLRATIVS